MEFTDLREAAVITDVPEPTDLTFTELTRSFTVKNTVNIVEIIQPQICNVRYKINIASSDSFVYWLTLPTGTYVTQAGSIWTIWGVTAENWDQIKNPTIELSPDYFGSFSYSAAIVYDLPSQANIEIEWNVGIYAPQSQLTAVSSFSINFTRRRNFNFFGQALFSQTANLRAAAFTPATKFNWSISTTNNFVGPIIYYPTTTGTWTITVTPDNFAKVTSITTTYNSGGTKSYNNATKTLTITGTKEQVNNHLNALQFVATNSKGDFNMLYTADNTVDDFIWETSQLANNLDVQYLNLPTVTSQTYLINTPKTIQGASTINDDEYDGSGNYTWTLTANPTNSVRTVTANYYENLPFYYDDGGTIRTPKNVTLIPTVESRGSVWANTYGYYFGASSVGHLRVTDMLGLGAGSWAVECWAELRTDNGKNQILWDYRTNSTANTAWNPVLYLSSDGSIRLNAKGQDRIIVSTNIPTNTTVWHHIAVVKNGQNTRIFYDGYAVGSTWVNTENFGVGLNGLCIGNSSDAVGGFNNTIGEFRVSNIARYTEPFNFDNRILYGPLNNDANTTLYLHGEVTNPLLRTIDDYGFPHTAKAITKVGSVGKSDFPVYLYNSGNRWESKGPGSEEDRCLVFNGGYLTFDASSGDFNFGTGDFTIEFWLYGNNGTVIDLRPTTATGVDASICIQVSGGSVQVIFKGQTILSTTTGTGNIDMFRTSGSITFNRFNHYALIKSGNIYRLLQNGIDYNRVWNGSGYVYSNRVWVDSANSPVANITTVGAIGATTRTTLGNNKFGGYMSNIRISNINRYPLTSSVLATGSEYRFSTNYYINQFDTTTYPTNKLFRWDNYTIFSPNQVGYFNESIIDGIYINKNPRQFTTIGSVRDRATGNFYFWGGYLNVDNTDKQLDFGTGDFTIHFNISHTNVNANQTIYDSRSTSGGLDLGLTIQMRIMGDSKKQIAILINGVVVLNTNYGNIGQTVAFGGSVPNQFYYATLPYGIGTNYINGGYYVLTRNNGVFTLYSGTSESVYNWGSYNAVGQANFTSTKNPVIGTSFDGTNPFYGTIDRFKIDKQGIAPESSGPNGGTLDIPTNIYPGITIPNNNSLLFLHGPTQYSAVQEGFNQSGFKIQGTRSDVNDKLKYLTLTPATNYNQTITVTYSVVTPRGSTNSHTATLTN
jgi:hypothetical protein